MPSGRHPKALPSKFQYGIPSGRHPKALPSKYLQHSSSVSFDSSIILEQSLPSNVVEDEFHHLETLASIAESLSSSIEIKSDSNSQNTLSIPEDINIASEQASSSMMINPIMHDNINNNSFRSSRRLPTVNARNELAILYAADAANGAAVAANRAANFRLIYPKKKRNKQFSAREKNLIIAMRKQSKKQKITYPKFINSLNNIGIKITKRSIQYWMKGKKNNATQTNYVETRGRNKIISPEQHDIILGFCFNSFKEEILLNPETLQDFINKYFPISVCLQYCYRFLKNNRFSEKKRSSRQAGYVYNADELIQFASIWFSEIFYPFIKNADPHKVISLDFTYSSYRKSKDTSWSPVGSKQQKKIEGHTRYTNCYVTACWPNGKKTIRMYTYNKQAKTIDDWKNSTTKSGKQCSITSNRQAAHDSYMNLLHELKIDPQFITWLDGNNSKTYVRECPELITQWLKDSKNDLKDNTLIIHDKGSAFNDIELNYEYINKSLHHIIYPPEVHELLSPNDNGWHGQAKRKWRKLCKERYINKKDGLEGSLLLFKCLTDVPDHVIRKKFRHNLFFDQKSISFQDISRLINERSFNILHSSKTIKLIQKYKNFI